MLKAQIVYHLIEERNRVKLITFFDLINLLISIMCPYLVSEFNEYKFIIIVILLKGGCELNYK